MEDLLNTLGKVLKPHAVLTSMGLSSERATQLIVNRDLSFQTKTMSLTQTFRDQLKKIAESVDININALLNMLSVNQIAQVIEDHRGIKWSDPDGDLPDKELVLSGITKTEHGVWWLSFSVPPLEGECSFELHDLEIQDVLALMQTCENIFDQKIGNYEKATIPA